MGGFGGGGVGGYLFSPPLSGTQQRAAAVADALRWDDVRTSCPARCCTASDTEPLRTPEIVLMERKIAELDSPGSV